MQKGVCRGKRKRSEDCLTSINDPRGKGIRDRRGLSKTLRQEITTSIVVRTVMIRKRAG